VRGPQFGPVDVEARVEVFVAFGGGVVVETMVAVVAVGVFEAGVERVTGITWPSGVVFIFTFVSVLFVVFAVVVVFEILFVVAVQVLV